MEESTQVPETTTQYLLMYPVVSVGEAEKEGFSNVEVTVGNGPDNNTMTYEFPTSMLENLLTDEPFDPGTQNPREYYLSVVAKSIVILLEKNYNVLQSEVQSVAQFTENFAHNFYAEATTLLWGGKKEHELTLSDVREVLNAEKERREGEAVEESAPEMTEA